jgi:hypothetical protein
MARTGRSRARAHRDRKRRRAAAHACGTDSAHGHRAPAQRLRGRLRRDVLGAEEREHPVRHRRRADANSDPRGAPTGRSRRFQLLRRGVLRRASRCWRPSPDRCARGYGRRVSSSDQPRRGPPAPHPRRGPQFDPGFRRPVVRPRRAARLRARAHRGLPLPGDAPRAAHPAPRRPVAASAQRPGRDRRRTGQGAARLLASPRRD